MGFFKPTDGKTKELNEQLDNIEKKIDDHIESCSSGSGSGEGLTTEQAQQLTTAYQHSQSYHVSMIDVNSAINSAIGGIEGGGDVSLYTGLLMDCLGDSITARNVYEGMIKEQLGFSNVLNHGIGGSCICGDNENCFWHDNRINALDENAFKRLTYVYDALKLTREKLSKDKALIGFCGSAWTIATYMIEGKGSKTYAKCKKMLYTKPELLHSLLEKINFALKFYLEEQIKAGANVVQIFDSWASALEKEAFFDFSFKYMKDLALEKLSPSYVLQGNLEPCRLYSKEAIKIGVENILNEVKNLPHIVNLGHGILPDIPVENAKYFVKLAQGKI